MQRLKKKKLKSVFKKFVGFAKHPFIKKNKPILHTEEWVLVLLAFFAVGFPIIFFQSTGGNPMGEKLTYSGDLNLQTPSAEEKKEFIGETISEPSFDFADWVTYRNQWYGFEIKHPRRWTNTQYRSATTKGARYETVYKFRKNSGGENDRYEGFDVAVYSTKKISGLEDTNEMQKTENFPEDTSNCRFSEDITLGKEENVFQKVSIKKNDFCYEPAYFFSITKGDYLYNIIPVAKVEADVSENPEQEVNENFPEYKQAVASLKLIPISRTTSAKTVSKPKITAPRPVSAKVVDGKLVCAKKKDKPGKSQQNKPGHMDMECCLDPDETPNPWCTYSNPKYQKYLK